jgi:K+ transporter
VTVKRALGIVSALFLTMGVFAPLVEAFGITTNYYNNGEGDGSIVLILVVTMLLMTPFTHKKWVRRALWPVIVLIISIIAIDFADSLDQVGLNHLSWGWIPLFAGSILAVAAALWRDRPFGPGGERQ